MLSGAVPRAQTPAPAIAMAGYPAVGEPAKVMILGTGTEPKNALRYSVPTTFKGHLEMVSSISMTMNVMGQSIDQSLPGLNMGIDLSVTGIAPNGDITYNIVFTSIKVDGGASNV